ncbi:MAG: cytochrome C [SAR86 cluster bacterium]|uniref:Cytochrome C n=1 Tax=SAR86 cluster bacterium TaxID=2030880 RepID=A0A2A4WZW3_9GAMM|nr:MAG: cytochrome C [SAR86 cluster bacterium]
MKKINIFAFLGIALVVVTGINMISFAAQGNFSSYVNDDGDISFPEGFRTSMVHLGSWFVPEGGASGFHDVYTERASVEAYRDTGSFPYGATLVKELRASQADAYTTGEGVSYATEEIKQWFVMIKDGQGRFDDNPVWGDGWGWALFAADDKTQNAASNYENDCLACHVPARDNDWIYIEAYPTLTRGN